MVYKVTLQITIVWSLDVVPSKNDLSSTRATVLAFDPAITCVGDSKLSNSGFCVRTSIILLPK
jgi:hypothetical protein